MTEAPTLRWNSSTPPEWDALLSQAGRSPLEQSWAYGEGLKNTRSLRGIIARGEEPIALVQAFERRVLSRFRLVQILRGPVWLAGEPDARTLRLIKEEFRARAGALLVWMPDLPAGKDSEKLMHAAGLRRMATGYSSAWIDLRKTDDQLHRSLHGKWRNALRAAKRHATEVDVSENKQHLDWLLERYESHRRAARYAGPSHQFARAMVDAGAQIVLLRASVRARDIGGILMVRHGASATYFIGWSNDEGRRVNAHNLLLWRGMMALKDRGVEWLDIGGINAASPGVARFKMGIGGEFFTLTGTYI